LSRSRFAGKKSGKALIKHCQHELLALEYATFKNDQE